jgi:hypothetical protein
MQSGDSASGIFSLGSKSIQAPLAKSLFASSAFRFAAEHPTKVTVCCGILLRNQLPLQGVTVNYARIALASLGALAGLHFSRKTHGSYQGTRFSGAVSAEISAGL